MTIENIGQLVRTLGSTGKFNAEQILEEVNRIFPGNKTTKKSIYSTLSVAKIHLPSSSSRDINEDALADLVERLSELKTGTDN